MTIVLSKESYNLLKKLNEFSPQTYEHSVRVSNLCVWFGKKMGLSDEDIEKLRIGGLFHDVGKLKIPEAILNKPARLTEEEYTFVKKHSVFGENLLVETGINDREILNLVLFHHERLDGLGYPKGLVGDEIPLLVRIVTICDSYDAMNSRRVYQGNIDMAYIRKELLENAGKQFDLECVHLLLEYLDEGLEVGPVVKL